MLLHNIKQTIRGMLKNKTYTFLNITGFAVGFAVVITIMLFAYKEYAVNRFIPNYEKVYRLVDEGNKGTLIDNSIVPELKNMYPEIEGVVSLFHFSVNGKYLDIKSVNSKDIIWVNNVISTSDNFFSLMGIKVLASKTATPFADINSLVFSKATALKMFGKVDVVDEYVEFMGKTLPISAVVEDIPTHSTLSADIYCNEKNNDLVSVGSDSPEGRYSISDIYLSLHQDANIDELLVKMNQKFPPNKSNTKNIKAQAVKDIYFSVPIDEMSYDKTGNKSLVWIFITIAILTLIMAVFNYVNFTISQQIATLKNSGIRITNGATKAQIRSYYITNVALAVSLAFVMGIVFSCIAMPLSSKLLAAELNPVWLIESKFMALLLGILLFVVVICSVLPVRFISRFNIQFLFGKSHFKSRKHPFKIAMTVAQVAISIILVVGLLTINKQLKYVKTADVGFDKELLVKLNLPRGYKKYDVLRDAIAKLPFVDNLSYTTYAPGGGSSGGYINPRSEDKIRVNTIVIDNQFIETFGMKLTHGTKLTETDVNRSCYISEATYKRLEGKYE